MSFDRNRKALIVVLTALSAAVVTFATPLAMAVPGAAQDDFPTTAGAARRYYEGWVDNWTAGPAEALMTVEEHDIWDSLEDTEQRGGFIRWFWDRRDPDGRAIGNTYQERFYEDVAYANLRYRGFPRGWKSDRGRVRLVLGEPDTVSRQTYAMLGGVGNGPDFEVWSYSNLGHNRAFQAPGGEFLVYFAETRIAHFEVYDFRWGAGVWDRNIRRAFEITVEASVLDPMMEFEAGEAEGSFVREITEGGLRVEIPTGIWADLGAGGAVSVPAQIRLGDLLFQQDGDVFVARLEATLSLDPADGSDESRVSKAWEVRLGEDELLALGNGSFVAAVTSPAQPGAHLTSLVVSHPLAATDAEWSQTVNVSAGPGTSIVVGHTALSLSTSDPSAVAIVMSADAAVDSGGTLVVAAWMRGAVGNSDALSIQLVAGGGTYALEVEEAEWLDGTAGPLLARARIPELEAGEYVLRVDFGAGLESASTPVQVGR
jgi:GWxTD domain-containing protein